MKRIILFALAVVVLTVVAGTNPAAAQPAPPRDQQSPDLLYMADRDEFLLAWTEDRGAGNRIFAKRVQSNALPVGGPAGGEWELTAPDAAGAKGDQRGPASTGGLVVWSELVAGGSDYDLYAQRLFTNGRGQGRPKLIAGGPGNQSYPDVVAGPANDFLVVWSEDTKDAGDIMGIRVSAALTPRGAPFPVAQGPGTAEDPMITRDLSDPRYYLVLWTDDRKGNKDIYGAHLVESGLPRGGPTGGQFAVIDSPEDDYAAAVVFSPIDLVPGRQSSRPGSDTRSILLWTTDHVTEGPNVMGIRLRSNGYSVGNAFTVAGGNGTQGWPTVALRAVGGERAEWLAAWADDGLGTLDVLSVEIGLNGIARHLVRPLASD